MSFFKDFKEDFSQAVNELMATEDVPENETADEMVVNTLEEDVDAKAEMDKLEGLLQKVEEPQAAEEQPESAVVLETVASETEKEAGEEEPETALEETAEASVEEEEPVIEAQEIQVPDPVAQEDTTEEIVNHEINDVQEDNEMAAEEMMETVETQATQATPKEVSDEVTIITAGTSITGNVESIGSMEICGKITGNVQCNGKLTVTGAIKGNSASAEFFADAAKIEGEINTEGTAKIGLGSVIIGNVSATSAVIAGAIKGDIDVQGPVVVDTSAVVMGNIKSRSVQINNGAVIEGFCSQCYADVDVAQLFDEK